MTVEVFNGAAWGPRLRSRGPSGRACPSTPAYATAATVTTNQAGLQAAINAANADTDVIELTGNLTGSVTLTSPAGASGWTRNLLIRPPIGQRAAASSLFVSGTKLTVAGINFTDPAGEAEIVGARSFVWRGFDDRAQLQIVVRGSGSAFIEWAAPYWGYNTGGNVSGADRVRLTAVAGTASTTAERIEGSYIAPKLLGIVNYTTALADSTPSTPLVSTTIAGDVTVGNDFPLVTVPGGGYSVTGIFLGLDKAPTSGAAVQVRLKVNGAAWVTYTLDETADRMYRRDATITRALVAGDVVTYDVLAAGPGARRLLISVGKDIKDLASPPHCDNIQAFVSSPNTLNDWVLKDNILGGTNSNRVLQVDTAQGECRVVNNFLGRIAGAPSLGVSVEGAGGGASNMREHYVDNEFQGAQPLGASGSIRTFKRNISHDTGFSGAYAPDATNASIPGIVPLPPCPDLTVVWPECPKALVF